KKTSDKDPRNVQGLPANPRFSNFRISPDEKKMAFLNTVSDRVDLWVLDIEKGVAKKLQSDAVNANLGFAINWFNDSNSLLIKTIPSSRKELINTSEATPQGPTVTVSEGEKA